MTSRPSTAAPILAVLAVGLVSLLVAYVGAYLALVQIEVRQTQFKEMPATWSMLTYKVGGDAVESFFDPINQLDRYFRPKTWEAVNTPYSLMEDFDDLEPIEPVDP